jgi:hypothetical protein
MNELLEEHKQSGEEFLYDVTLLPNGGTNNGPMLFAVISTNSAVIGEVLTVAVGFPAYVGLTSELIDEWVTQALHDLRVAMTESLASAEQQAQSQFKRIGAERPGELWKP